MFIETTVSIKVRFTTKQNREHGATNLLPLRFKGVWQTNVCLAPPAGLECEASRDPPCLFPAAYIIRGIGS